MSGPVPADQLVVHAPVAHPLPGSLTVDTVRPKPVKSGPALWFACLAVLCNLAGVMLKVAPRHRLDIGIGFALFVVAFAVLVVEARRKAAFTWDGSVLRMHGLRGARVLQRRGDPAGRVVRATVLNGQAGRQAWRLWLDAEGRCVARIAESYWDTAELDRLDGLAGLATDVDTKTHPIREMADLYPGSAPRWAARPWFGAVAALVVIVVVAALATVL